MKRRDFITLIGGAAAAMPTVAKAQQGGRRVAVLSSFGENDPQGQVEMQAFRLGLEELGWTPGKNIQVEYRWFANNVDRMQAFAKELVDLRPDVIFARATPTVAAFLQLTRTIPIVFVSVSDPIGQGFVSSLARPGGNVTGFTAFEFSIGGKLMQTLKDIAPSIRRAAVIFNPKTAPYFQLFLRPIEAAAGTMAMQIVPLPLQDASQLEGAISAFAQEPHGGLIFPSDGFSTSNRSAIIALALRHRLPAIYSFRVFAADGGLVAYGINPVDQFRRGASYVDRILRGENAGELPIQQPTKFELVINLKTAKSLGLEIKPQLLSIADELIE